MTTNFVLALKAEIAQLEDELRSDPRCRKLARLRETLAEYEPSQAYAAIYASTGSISPGVSLTTRTKGAKIKDEITDLLRQRGKLHRKQILSHLTTLGLMGHEKDPMMNLAAYLSSWKDIFDFDGSGNWSLKKRSEPLKAAE